MRAANLIAVVMAVCVALLACKKDKDEEKGELAKSAAAKPEAPSAKYTAGDVLKYVPKNCNERRLFVNVAKLIGPNKADVEAMKKSLLTGEDPDTKKAQKTLQVLADGGFDPVRDIQEVAICADKSFDAVIAVGVNLDQVKGDPLDLLSKAVLAGGGDGLKKEKQDGYSYLSKPNEKGVVALVKPSVLVLAENASVAATAAKGEGASGFGTAGASLVHGDFAERGEKYTIVATEKGTNVELSLTIKPKDKKPEDLMTELQAAKLGFIKELEQSPMKGVVQDLKKVQFAIKGDAVVTTLTLPRSRISELMKEGAKMKPEEIMGAL